MIWAMGMTNERLEEILRRTFDHMDGEPGCWRIPIDDFELLVVTNEVDDRMRLMVPIAEAPPTDRELPWVLLCANFDRAVDARYAVHEGIVWCTFMHRLSWLTEAEIEHAVDAVVTLARNTGTTFASGELVFRPRSLDEVPEEL